MPSRLTERELPSSSEQATLPIAVACAHCGTACGATPLMKAERPFCCQGCQLVFELLTENGLGNFYELSENAGVRIGGPAKVEQYQYLDEPAVRGLYSAWTGLAAGPGTSVNVNAEEPSRVELTFEQEDARSPSEPPLGWGS